MIDRLTTERPRFRAERPSYDYQTALRAERQTTALRAVRQIYSLKVNQSLSEAVRQRSGLNILNQWTT